MSAHFMQFKPLLIAALETGLNRYLGLDEHLEQLLTPMVGKILAIHVTPFNETVYLCPAQDRIQLLEKYVGEVDAKLSGSLSALGLMGLSATPMRALFKGEVRIEGDTLLAQKLQRLFEKLDINLEGKLARYSNDSFAQKISTFFRGGLDWTRHTSTSFRLNLEEFLQEETRDLPAKTEAELVFQQIDACRSDIDRLNARIERLLGSQSE